MSLMNMMFDALTMTVYTSCPALTGALFFFVFVFAINLFITFSVRCLVVLRDTVRKRFYILYSRLDV